MPTGRGDWLESSRACWVWRIWLVVWVRWVRQARRVNAAWSVIVVRRVSAGFRAPRVIPGRVVNRDPRVPRESPGRPEKMVSMASRVWLVRRA